MQKITVNHHRLGRWQRKVLRELEEEGRVAYEPAYLKGSARLYYESYVTAFDALVQALVSSGYIVRCKLGPRGGLWSSIWSVDAAQRTEDGPGSLVVVDPRVEKAVSA